MGNPPANITDCGTRFDLEHLIEICNGFFKVTQCHVRGATPEQRIGEVANQPQRLIEGCQRVGVTIAVKCCFATLNLLIRFLPLADFLLLRIKCLLVPFFDFAKPVFFGHLGYPFVNVTITLEKIKRMLSLI